MVGLSFWVVIFSVLGFKQCINYYSAGNFINIKIYINIDNTNNIYVVYKINNIIYIEHDIYNITLYVYIYVNIVTLSMISPSNMFMYSIDHRSLIHAYMLNLLKKRESLKKPKTV